MSEVQVQENIEKSLHELREVLDTVPSTVKSLDEKVQALGAENQEKAEKIEAYIAKQDDIAQKLVLEEERAKKEKAEMAEQIKHLEEIVVKSSVVEPVEYKESNEFKAFNALVKNWDVSSLKADEQEILTKSMRTDINEFGGFLVPATLASELLREIQEISPVRSLARVRTTETKTLNVPIGKTIPNAPYEGEAEAADKSQSTYKSETLTAHRQHVIIPITRDQLNFSAFDMSSEIAQDAITAFAQSEGNAFILGNGVKKPLGIISQSTVNGGNIQTETVSGGSLTLDAVIELAGELKEGYNPVYFFNRKTLAALRTEKDNNGNYLWRIGGESMPSEINGYRYVIMQDMADSAVSAIPVGFGDFFRGYNILDALQMELIRDDVTRKSEAIIEFSWNRYNDGRPVLEEAFKLLQVTA